MASAVQAEERGLLRRRRRHLTLVGAPQDLTFDFCLRSYLSD